MTRKDYKTLERAMVALRAKLETSAWVQVMDMLVHSCKMDNAAFDGERFREGVAKALRR